MSISMDKLEAALGAPPGRPPGGGRPGWMPALVLAAITLGQSFAGALIWRVVLGFFKSRGWEPLASPQGSYLLLVAVAVVVDLKAPRLVRWVRDLAIGASAVSFAGSVLQWLAAIAK